MKHFLFPIALSLWLPEHWADELCIKAHVCGLCFDSRVRGSELGYIPPWYQRQDAFFGMPGLTSQSSPSWIQLLTASLLVIQGQHHGGHPMSYVSLTRLGGKGHLSFHRSPLLDHSHYQSALLCSALSTMTFCLLSIFLKSTKISSPIFICHPTLSPGFNFVLP